MLLDKFKLSSQRVELWQYLNGYTVEIYGSMSKPFATLHEAHAYINHLCGLYNLPPRYQLENEL